MSSPRWLTPTVFGIAMASLFSDLSHETFTSVLPAFLGTIGGGAAALGIIEGAADGLSCFAKLYGGWLADRVERRKIICASGYGVMAIAPLIIASAVTWPVVLLGRGMAWLSKGIRTPARKALLAEAVTPETRGRAFGFERAMDTTGAIAAPVLVLILMNVGFTHRALIYFSIIPALIAVLAIIFLVKETPGRVPVKREFLKSFTGFSAGFKQFLGAIGLFGLGDFADTFFILYAVEKLKPTLGPETAAAYSVGFYALHNICYASWAFLGGWMADNWNKRLVLALGYGVAALAVLGMVLGVSSLAGLALVFVCAGIGIGIYEAVEDVIAADLLPPERRGGGYGAMAVVTGIGDMLSSALAGWLWFSYGEQYAFGAALALMGGGIALTLLLARKKD